MFQALYFSPEKCDAFHRQFFSFSGCNMSSQESSWTKTSLTRSRFSGGFRGIPAIRMRVAQGRPEFGFRLGDQQGVKARRCLLQLAAKLGHHVCPGFGVPPKSLERYRVPLAADLEDPLVSQVVFGEISLNHLNHGEQLGYFPPSQGANLAVAPPSYPIWPHGAMLLSP